MTELVGCALLVILASAGLTLPFRAQPSASLVSAVGQGYLMVALLGYVSFWAWYLGPATGRGFTWAIVTFAAIRMLQVWQTQRWRGLMSEVSPGFELVAVALIFTLNASHLLLFAPDQSDLFAVAANRYIAGLPIDNTLPGLLAEKMARGHPLQVLTADWLVSDRPPLQSGLILFFRPITGAVGISPPVLAQSVGMLFQLWWIPAALALASAAGMPRAGARALILVAATSTTLFINTSYVWPKLGAAAAVVTAFALLWRDSSPKLALPWLAGLHGAVAWLSHGGVAFSLLPMVGLLLVQRRLRWRGLLIFAGIGLIVTAPWFWFQHAVNPPGDRLLKWHLAGVESVDTRNIWTTLGDAYGAAPWSEIVDHKLQNLKYPWYFTTQNWFAWGREHAIEHRYTEFYFLGAAVGPWLLPTVAWIVLGLLHRVRRDSRFTPTDLREGPDGRVALSALGWTALTVAFWTMLMFGPATTSIHQGSLALPLALTVLGMTLAWRLHRAVFAVIAFWQFAHYVVYWLPAPNGINVEVEPFVAAVWVLILGGMIGSVGWNLFRPSAVRLGHETGSGQCDPTP